MLLMIILKVTKKQVFTLSVENTSLEKPQGVGQIDPPVFLGLNLIYFCRPPLAHIIKTSFLTLQIVDPEISLTFIFYRRVWG